jgi:hypothetical protein
MVDVMSVVIPAVKFGYNRYGPKGAVAAAIAVGGSHLVIKSVIPKYTDIEQERVDEIYSRLTDDGELGDILGKEFVKRFGNYFDEDGGAASPVA